MSSKDEICNKSNIDTTQKDKQTTEDINGEQQHYLADTMDMFELAKRDLPLDDLLQQSGVFFAEKDLVNYINEKIAEKGMTKADVIRKSGFNKRFFYEVAPAKDKPSRKRAARRYIIRILMTLQIDLEEIQKVLQRNSYLTLYPKNPEDFIIINCIANKKSVIQCNKMLNEACFENLGFENDDELEHNKSKGE